MGDFTFNEDDALGVDKLLGYNENEGDRNTSLNIWRSSLDDNIHRQGELELEAD